jgi:predicted nuclease with TOPRIM domain
VLSLIEEINTNCGAGCLDARVCTLEEQVEVLQRENANLNESNRRLSDQVDSHARVIEDLRRDVDTLLSCACNESAK